MTLDRGAEVLQAAYRVAQRVGIENMTRVMVAQEAKVACGTINHYFVTMDALKASVVARAIREQNLPLVAEAIFHKRPETQNIPRELHISAINTLMPNEVKQCPNSQRSS